jgi:hypothetical protein
VLSERVKLGQRLGVERHLESAHVLFEPPNTFGARNGDHGDSEPRALGTHPGQRHLCWRDTETGGDSAHRFGYGLIGPPGIPQEARAPAADVCRAEGSAIHCSGEEPPFERRGGGETDSPLRHDRASASGSRVQREYSLCPALIGCTARALRSSDSSTSLSPR